MTDGIIKAVDFRMQELMRNVDPEKTMNVQMTVRIPETLKIKLDVLSTFMGGTRNSLLTEFLEIACDEAIERVKDNPFITGFLVNGLTIDQALDEQLKADKSAKSELMHKLEVGEISADQFFKEIK